MRAKPFRRILLGPLLGSACAKLKLGVITLHKDNDRLAREVIEAMEIEEGADNCVTIASVALIDKEKLFLRTVAPRPRG